MVNHCVNIQKCYLAEQTARLGANPEDLVSRCGDQQVFSGGWREADLQCGIKTGALYVQNTHVYMEQLDRDGMGQCGHMQHTARHKNLEQHDLQSSGVIMNIFQSEWEYCKHTV